jgi:hypothetical protein
MAEEKRGGLFTLDSCMMRTYIHINQTHVDNNNKEWQHCM